MKKSFFVLPFVTLALAACSNNSAEAPAADVTSTAIPSWQSPEVQQTSMPSSMTQPSYPQPTYQPAPQPMPQPVYNAPQPSYQPTGEMVGNCNVVRDANGTPVYAQMQKGCYTGDTYTVGKSDTVFLVSFLAGKPVSEIARLNNLAQPYQLKMGQQLRLK